MSSKQIIYQVDAFTTAAFKGNPAGVCILDMTPSPEWMQNIAMEMNLSETAFVFPGKNGERKIKFYTPEAEVPLCGHATLSASHILYETGLAGHDEKIVFSSLSGALVITKVKNWITMNFPADTLKSVEDTAEFRKVTGINPEELYETGNFWSLALVEDEDALKKVSPDLIKMKNSKYGDLIVTAPSPVKEFDYSIRCFAPAVGINEDPVTGSAQCALAPFWYSKTGRKDFVCHQVSKREGILRVSLKDDRVDISGQAVTVFRAELM
ncbi:MAG TPA: PhzF family phenazine biosynthesis protein [Bacteroidales bacterium]|nr:PhzF family phenazine biosynthesis protein [Bacteroidales bacterium]